MDLTHRVFLDLLQSWQQAGVCIKPPLPSSELHRIFAELGIVLTRDVAEFYSIVGGMPTGCPDDHMFELWGPDRIKEENSKSRWAYCWFADWLISSHHYALKPVNSERSAVFIDHHCDRDTPPELLTDSLYQFADQLIRDPASVGVLV